MRGWDRGDRCEYGTREGVDMEFAREGKILLSGDYRVTFLGWVLIPTSGCFKRLVQGSKRKKFLWLTFYEEAQARV